MFDFDQVPDIRDIVLKTHEGQLIHISELHGAYDPLQYPLLFPYGEYGWQRDILRTEVEDDKDKDGEEDKEDEDGENDHDDLQTEQSGHTGASGHTGTSGHTGVSGRTGATQEMEQLGLE